MEGLCRGCLNQFDEPTDLLQYCESNRRLFVYSTGLQVKRNDVFTFQLCKECYVNMKLSCKFKKQCRNSDKKFKHYLSLKEDGDSIDFSSYLKNAKDTLALGLPIISSSSTPIHQGNKDDDNESTCTSIQNFMSDMLDGEEMPPTEARIIREVIQEEADILDDTLDSHWLEDDNSMGSDFGVDFNFSTFSSPQQHSISSDRGYTPKKLADKKEELNYYTSKEIIKRESIADTNDMPVLDNFGIDELVNVADSNISIETALRIRSIIEINKQMANQNDMPFLDDANVKLHNVDCSNNGLGDLETEFRTQQIKERDMTGQNPFPKLESFKDYIFSESNYVPLENNVSLADGDEEISHNFIEPTTNQNDLSLIINKEPAEKQGIDSPMTRELNYYMYKNERKKANNHKSRANDKEIFNQGKDYKMTEHSPFTSELEQYINKAKLKKIIDSDLNSINSDSNSSDQVLGILKGRVNSSKEQQIHKPNIVEFGGKNLYDSPLKQEIEQYITKVKTKRTKKQALHKKREGQKEIHDELYAIDKKNKLELKKEESKEFSLDQLLVSPAVTMRSGASTPTINNIIFGRMTPLQKERDSNFVEIAMKEELDCADFIEEFLNDDDCKPQSTPYKITGGKPAGFKDVKKRKKSKHKSEIKHTRGFKDINRLKELLKEEQDDLTSEPSENDEESMKIEQVKIEENEPIEKPVSPIQEIEDMDISLTGLLNFDDNQSVDLNMSISSDFLKDTEVPDNPKIEQAPEVIEDPFKRPFSPPDNKYDLDKRLCKICNTTFGSSRGLSIHFMKIHKTKIQKLNKKKNRVYKICQFCGKGFRDQSNLNKHLKKHEEPDDVTCKLCYVTFKNHGRLKQHMRVHKDEIGETNTDKENDKSKDKKKYVCSTCGLVTTNICNFKLHQRRHTKSYTIKCNVCQKGFYRMSDLDQHMTNHTREFKFACQFCPKLYKRRTSLIEHMKRHLDKIRYECSVCNLKFVSKVKLKNHYATQLCLNNGDLAKEMQEHSNSPVTVMNAVGSTEKIKEIMDNERISKETEHNNESVDLGKDVKEEVSVSLDIKTEEIKAEPSETIEISKDLIVEKTEEDSTSESLNPKPMEEG